MIAEALRRPHARLAEDEAEFIRTFLMQIAGVTGERDDREAALASIEGLLAHALRAGRSREHWWRLVYSAVEEVVVSADVPRDAAAGTYLHTFLRENHDLA
jgi:hypothetical protein